MLDADADADQGRGRQVGDLVRSLAASRDRCRVRGTVGSQELCFRAPAAVNAGEHLGLCRKEGEVGSRELALNCGLALNAIVLVDRAGTAVRAGIRPVPPSI